MSKSHRKSDILPFCTLTCIGHLTLTLKFHFQDGYGFSIWFTVRKLQPFFLRLLTADHNCNVVFYLPHNMLKNDSTIIS